MVRMVSDTVLYERNDTNIVLFFKIHFEWQTFEKAYNEMHTRDKCNFTNAKLDLHIMSKLNKTALQLKRLDI